MGEEGSKEIELSSIKQGPIEEAIPPRRRKRKCLKCCGVCCALLILIVVVLAILVFTVFKAKKPQIHVDKISLDSFSVSISLIPPKFSLQVTLGFVVSVKNPNKVGFKYTNSTAFLFYRGVEVGLVPIPSGHIGADGTEQISSTLELLPDRLITNTHIFTDLIHDSLPFSTTTDISGRIDFFHIFKHHVDTSTVCNITISILNKSIDDAVCTYDVKL